MAKVGEGVHNVYKERAAAGGDVLWYVKIKGQKELAPGIPLHMSLKVFPDKKEMDLEEIKAKIKQFDIVAPVPSKLTYKTTIFTSERDGNKYYMLKLEGTDKSYEEFYNSMKHCGTVYKQFMPHITIDKGLYDKINEEGLKPEEVSFSVLSIEAGCGNTIHKFAKSEDMVQEVIRETIRLNVDLSKYASALRLNGNDFANFLQDNPQLRNEALKKHRERIEFHFAGDKRLIEIALEKGLKEAYRSQGK